jgi:SP family general alpha glucoside:H+ symporter-like MFS transporter
MSGLAESKHDATQVGDVDREKDYHERAEVLDDKELMSDAQNAENREHDMTIWEAVKDHPMACFWAFIFCFTIVSSSALWAFPCL